MDLCDISLRPFRLTDADGVFSWAGDERVTMFMQREALSSTEEAETFIREVCIPHPWCRSVCFNDRSIGFVSVSPGSGDERCRADITYALAVDFWGRGIATKVLQMAVPLAFAQFPNVVRLQAYVHLGNKASQRVLEKAAFLKEGVLRKYLYVKGQIKDLVLLYYQTSMYCNWENTHKSLLIVIH